MAGSLEELVRCWIAGEGSIRAWRPTAAALEAGFPRAPESCRPGADPRAIDAWEERHGYRLARRAAGLADALERSVPLAARLIHPISAIGPMIPFARVPDLIVQPESWFELGNPNVADRLHRPGAIVCPGGGFPIFTSGDDAAASPPADHRAQLRGLVSRAAAAGGPRILVRPRFRRPWRPLAVAPAARRRPRRCPTGSARSPAVSCPLLARGADERVIAATWVSAGPTSSRSSATSSTTDVAGLATAREVTAD